jgi:hypothetical protein
MTVDQLGFTLKTMDEYQQWCSSLNPDFDDLDPEEQELRDSIDNGEWVSELTPERLQELQEAARKTLDTIYP